MWKEKTITGLWDQIERMRHKGGSIGLVPTMGALHEGHLALVKEAKKQCDEVIVTIFVNPTQFGQGEDLDRYPRTLDSDLKQCQKRGVAGVFMPDEKEIYPEVVKLSGATVAMDVPGLTDDLEGKIRPGHFPGVCRVVLKLLNLVQPDIAFFGQKDYQQLRVIEAMATDLNLSVDIEPCPTIREKDGLAMSSRNRYLNESQRQRALAIYMALSEAKALVISGTESDPKAIEMAMAKILSDQGLDVEYAVLRDAMTLRPVEGPISESMLEMIDEDTPEDSPIQECPWGLVALVAAIVPAENEDETPVRLIDNMLMSQSGQSAKE